MYLHLTCKESSHYQKDLIFYVTNFEPTEMRCSWVSNPWSSQTPYDGYNHPATGHVELGCLQGYLWHAVPQFVWRILGASKTPFRVKIKRAQLPNFIPNIYPTLQYGQVLFGLFCHQKMVDRSKTYTSGLLGGKKGRTAQAKPVWDIIWRTFLNAQSDTKMWNWHP